MGVRGVDQAQFYSYSLGNFFSLAFVENFTSYLFRKNTSTQTKIRERYSQNTERLISPGAPVDLPTCFNVPIFHAAIFIGCSLNRKKSFLDVAHLLDVYLSGFETSTSANLLIFREFIDCFRVTLGSPDSLGWLIIQ